MSGQLEIVGRSKKDAGLGDGSFYECVTVINHSDRLYKYVGIDATCTDGSGQVVAKGLGNELNVAAGEKVVITVIFMGAQGCDIVDVKFDGLTEIL